MKLSVIIRNFFAPPHCAFCDQPIPVEKEQLICSTCEDTLPLVQGRTCQYCDIPLDSLTGDLVCIPCKQAPPRHLLQNISRYVYKDRVQEAILRMKFGSRQLWVAQELGRFLAQTVAERYADVAFDYIIPVPLSKKSFKKRKFNQSEELAIAIAKALHVPLLFDCLCKIRETPAQSSRKAKEREQNIRGAYAVNRAHLLEGKVILLVDDVFTTGATLRECSKTLKKAGTLAIYTTTVAIVKHE